MARLAQLIESGIPVAMALEAGGRAGGSAGALLANLSRSVARGRRLSQALAGIGGCNPTEIALIAAGESSGRLDHAIALLSRRMISRAENRHRLLRAALYPMFLVGLTLAIVTAIGLFVVPAFASMYSGLGVTLPTSTRLLVRLSSLAVDYGIGFLVTLLLLGALAHRFVRGRPSLSLRFDAMLLRLPLVGRTLGADAKHDLYATLSALVDAGMELDRAIALTGPAIGNRALREALVSVGDLIERGWLPSAAIIRAGLDPEGDDAGLVRTAETTGQYAACFSNLAAVAAAERDERTQTVSRLLEPTAVIVMAVAVAIVIVGVYQPILGSATLLIGDIK